MNSFRWKGKCYIRSRRWLVWADGDSTPVLLDDCLGEEQSETDSLALGRVERLENMGGNFRIDAHTSIGKPHHKMAVVACEFDLEPAALGHRLRRIGDDVDKAGSHLLGINVENSLHLSAFLDHLDSLTLELRVAERQHAIDQLAQVGGRRKNLDRLSIMKERLHHLRQPLDLILHYPKLVQEVVASAQKLWSVAHPHLIERQADEVQWILYLMRQSAGELAKCGKAIE